MEAECFTDDVEKVLDQVGRLISFPMPVDHVLLTTLLIIQIQILWALGEETSAAVVSASSWRLGVLQVVSPNANTFPGRDATMLENIEHSRKAKSLGSSQS